MKYLFSLIFGLCTMLATQAQQTIADRINASGKASISQPELLNARLVARVAAEEPAEKPATATTTGGYRIQVYSGNNARIAKNEAENRAAMIRGQFPDIAAYVIYDAPYWRLRAGDFSTYEEAAAALGDLKRAFPSFAREMRLVRDRIHVK